MRNPSFLMFNYVLIMDRAKTCSVAIQILSAAVDVMLARHT
jgi:hypothetical protein